MMYLRILFVLIIAVSYTGCAQVNDGNSYSVQELKDKLKSDEDFVLLDVRTPEELRGPLGMIDGAINIPVQELNYRMKELEPYKDKEIVVICRTQNRSGKAVEMLKSKGYNAKKVNGGMSVFSSSK